MPIVPTPGALVYVQGDKAVERVKRRGRFSIERDRAVIPARMQQAITEAQEEMVRNLARVGYRYVDQGFTLEGPLEHIAFSDDSAPDPGPLVRPHVHDRGNYERWEKAEKARTAKRYAQHEELVDFILVATFEHAAAQRTRVHIPENR